MIINYNPGEIINALQVIKNLCLSFEDCSQSCPLYCSGCALREDVPPEQWQLNETYADWHAFKNKY